MPKHNHVDLAFHETVSKGSIWGSKFGSVRKHCNEALIVTSLQKNRNLYLDIKQNVCNTAIPYVVEHQTPSL